VCRFILYAGPPLTLSSLITEPGNSLIHQSFESYEREEPLNGDGFGVAWYVPDLSEAPAVFRSVSPAWSNRNLMELARVTRSNCILAHVRAATSGLLVSEANCHPFAHRQFCFMHNGEVGGFHRLRRALLAALSDESFAAIGGTTDSEHIFALFLDQYLKVHVADPVQAMAESLRAAIKQVLALGREAGCTETSYLNIAVSDGKCSVVSRVTTDPANRSDSLYFQIGKEYTCDGGLCRMLEAPNGHGGVIVSSERLSCDEGWQPVPVNHLVVIDHDHTASVVPF